MISLPRPVTRIVCLLLLLANWARSSDNRGTITGWVFPSQAGDVLVCAFPSSRSAAPDCVTAEEQKFSILYLLSEYRPRVFTFAAMEAPDQYTIVASQPGFSGTVSQDLPSTKTRIIKGISLSRVSAERRAPCLIASLGFPPAVCSDWGLPFSGPDAWSGSVRNQQGDVIPGARIGVVCTSKNQVDWAYSTQTGEDGAFAIPDKPCLTTEPTLLVATADGYKSHVTVLRDGRPEVSIELHRAAASNTAPVRPTTLATGPPAPLSSQGQVDVSEASRRAIFDNTFLLTLPLPGIRTVDSLALLAPGVLPPPPTNGIPGPGISAGIGAAGQFTVNGLRSRDNNFTMDGSDNNEEDVGVRPGLCRPDVAADRIRGRISDRYCTGRRTLRKEHRRRGEPAFAIGQPRVSWHGL